MIMAYMKLRRRNLAPVLNANGWAVNADAIISVPFGKTLTEQVAFPLVKIKKGMTGWQKWLLAIGIIIVIIGIVLCAWYLGCICIGPCFC